MSSRLLSLLVFLSGAVVMIFEIAGSRLLAPHIGTSLYIWTSLIGVILLSLSIGYTVGGRLADREPRSVMLSYILAIASICIGLTIYMTGDVVHITSFIDDLRLRAVVLSLLLFAPASMCLGMVSPYAVKLALHSLSDSGKTIGNLYALSTIGSITGTFLAGFVLIPQFGVRTVLCLVCIILLLLSLAASFPYKKRAGIGIVFFIVSMGIPEQSVYGSTLVHEVDSQYGHITLLTDQHLESGRPVLRMKINNESSSAMFLDGTDLVYDYTTFYRLIHHFAPNTNRALMIGGAAYSYPKDFLLSFDSATLDVVEIDPVVTQLAYDYFHLPHDPRLRIIHTDGRIFLNTATTTYDVIFNDAYASLYSIPHHLTTKEAVEHMYRLLSDNGVVFSNIISPIEGDGGAFLRAAYATYASVFPHVMIFPVRTTEDGLRKQNIMLIALKSRDIPVLESTNPEMQTYLDHLFTRPIERDMPILTDDYAPVEYYVQKMF
jgi:spermidine synthase